MTTAAHSGFVSDSGVQNHSAGDHFPILSYRCGDHARVAYFQGVERVRTCPDEHWADLQRMKLAEQITDRIHDTRPEGFTHWMSETPTHHGYVVSLPNRESLFPGEGRTWGPIFADIVGKLEFLDHPNWSNVSIGVGVWFNRRICYVDVSIWILNLEDAIRAGRAGDQLAIWDLKNNEAIDIF